MRSFIRTLFLVAGLLAAAPALADSYEDMLRAIEIDDSRTIATLL